MANAQPPSARFGCLGMIVGAVVLGVIVALVVFAGLFVLAIAAALLVIGLVIVGVDRLMLKVSPKRRERRESQARAFVWRYGPTQGANVIDATAIDATDRPTDPDPRDGKPDQPDQL
jgi:predicted lipid-binding transport protein (Tim44 family)